jgi:CheY-like chemotaxis protein
MKCTRILLAEDNADIRETLAEVLALEGFDVETAANGKEALERLQGDISPVLILLDLMMPVMSGWEFLDAQKVNPDLEKHPVVVLSAVPATQSLDDLSPLDAVDSLAKPIDITRLLQTVERYCDRKVGPTVSQSA